LGEPSTGRGIGDIQRRKGGAVGVVPKFDEFSETDQHVTLRRSFSTTAGRTVVGSFISIACGGVVGGDLLGRHGRGDEFGRTLAGPCFRERTGRVPPTETPFGGETIATDSALAFITSSATVVA
jgi:hypothetical protein